MADQKIYIGSVGPLLYDDAALIDDADGDFPGEDYHALVTGGQLLIETAPTNVNHVVRLQDLSDLVNPSFTDVTASRALDTVYHNGTYLTFAQISLRLRESSGPTTAPAPTTVGPTTAPLEGARAKFLTDAANPPTVVTGIVAKALAFGGNEYIEVTLSVIVLPNHYYMLEEDQHLVEILRWVEYQMGV